MKNCTICGKPLPKPLDEYGWVGEELCFDCYFNLADEKEFGDSWYGLAPHHHDLGITGSFIGSTVFDTLPEPDENGNYHIGGLVFHPDHETDGAGGVWSREE